MDGTGATGRRRSHRNGAGHRALTHHFGAQLRTKGKQAVAERRVGRFVVAHLGLRPLASSS